MREQRQAADTPGTPANRRAAKRLPCPSLAAFHVLDQAPLGLDLAFGQDILLALVRVGALAEQERHRRAHQLEALAEEILQVALVRIRQLLQARAVDDEGRRVAAARVYIAQLGDMPADG